MCYDLQENSENSDTKDKVSSQRFTKLDLKIDYLRIDFHFDMLYVSGAAWSQGMEFKYLNDLNSIKIRKIDDRQC